MFLICSGKIVKKPVVVDGNIVIRDMMSTIWTVDHRYGDAALAIKFVNIVRDFT